MADIKVSVIMPVYGVEDYVGKAIESIQAQTLTDAIAELRANTASDYDSGK